MKPDLFEITLASTIILLSLSVLAMCGGIAYALIKHV